MGDMLRVRDDIGNPPEPIVARCESAATSLIAAPEGTEPVASRRCPASARDQAAASRRLPP
jgi:hypothetical protein